MSRLISLSRYVVVIPVLAGLPGAGAATFFLRHGAARGDETGKAPRGGVGH